MQTKENIMTYNDVVSLGDAHLLPVVTELFGLEGYEIQLIPAHDGGRNVVYTCEKEGTDAKILRIAFLPDRNREDFLAEVEYIRYLFEHGGSVSDVVCSRKGNLLEEITYQNHTFYICLFKKAKGKLLVENNYRYREGVPLSEYFYNCGKTLGKLHHISKEYTPVHRRYSFFDKYNAEYINKLIPDSFSLIKKKLVELLNTLEGLDTNSQLPLFIQVCDMENIVDYFEVMQNSGEEPRSDEVMSYIIKCLEDDIPYKGFFHDIYLFEEPFEYEERNI
ncbi:aminoglycoside phosphotransferase [Paenibacillus sp. MER 180]|nr:aminoglycoside phosphotransferase [Paenibacillus sp. MER 180]